MSIKPLPVCLPGKTPSSPIIASKSRLFEPVCLRRIHHECTFPLRASLSPTHMCLCDPPGLGGLEEAPGLAGGTPGGEVRRLGPPAGGPAHKTVWEPPPGGRHQDLLVRHGGLGAFVYDCPLQTFFQQNMTRDHSDLHQPNTNIDRGALRELWNRAIHPVVPPTVAGLTGSLVCSVMN